MSSDISQAYNTRLQNHILVILCAGMQPKRQALWKVVHLIHKETSLITFFKTRTRP